MRYLQVRLAAGDATLHPLVPTLTDATVFRNAMMLEWTPSFDPPRANVLLYLEGDLEAFDALLADTALVREHDVTRIDGDRGYAYVHSDPHPIEWRLFEIAAERALLPVFPFRYDDDGSITVRFLGPLDRLRAALEATPEGVEPSIEKVGAYDLGRPPIPPPLPPRQREAVEVALEAGYYAVPREASRADVAAVLGCAPSTASEHLRKAERRLVRAFLDRPG